MRAVHASEHSARAAARHRGSRGPSRGTWRCGACYRRGTRRGSREGHGLLEEDGGGLRSLSLQIEGVRRRSGSCEREKERYRERGGRTRVGREGRGAEVLICRSPATRGGARQGFGHAAHGRSWHPWRRPTGVAVGEEDRAARLPAALVLREPTRMNSRRPALQRWCSTRGEGGIHGRRDRGRGGHRGGCRGEALGSAAARGSGGAC